MNPAIFRISAIFLMLGFYTQGFCQDSKAIPTKITESKSHVKKNVKNSHTQNNQKNSQLLADELALDSSFTDPEILLELSLREAELMDSR
ncbi:MAG TPA: hypothetical protein VFP93_03220 [Gammaproteobacteria bacterium]|nr:hypothetical protein [Gammaproteobacteria bacterium]